MELNQLQSTYSKPGKVIFMGVRSARREPITIVEKVMATAEKGLDGDRYDNKGGQRQVTLIQAEHLKAVGSIIGRIVSPEDVRRNIVIEGLNLISLKGKRFRIGKALFEYSGECHPCSRMEENLGTGGYNAMRGHGGITARVLEGGLICVGDLLLPEA
jgi:MOSC domain-containing protein YiiM